MWQTGRNSKASLLESPLCPMVSGWPSKIIYMCALSHWPGNCPLSIWNPRPLPPSPLLRMAYKLQLPNGSQVLYLYGSPAWTSIIKFGHLILLICLILISLLTQPEKLRKISSVISQTDINKYQQCWKSIYVGEKASTKPQFSWAIALDLPVLASNRNCKVGTKSHTKNWRNLAKVKFLMEMRPWSSWHRCMKNKLKP